MWLKPVVSILRHHKKKWMLGKPNMNMMEKKSRQEKWELGHRGQLVRTLFFFIWREKLHSNQGQQQLWASVIGHLGEPSGFWGDQSKCDLCMSDGRVLEH